MKITELLTEASNAITYFRAHAPEIIKDVEYLHKKGHLDDRATVHEVDSDILTGIRIFQFIVSENLFIMKFKNGILIKLIKPNLMFRYNNKSTYIAIKMRDLNDPVTLEALGPVERAWKLFRSNKYGRMLKSIKPRKRDEKFHNLAHSDRFINSMFNRLRVRVRRKYKSREDFDGINIFISELENHFLNKDSGFSFLLSTVNVDYRELIAQLELKNAPYLEKLKILIDDFANKLFGHIEQNSFSGYEN